MSNKIVKYVIFAVAIVACILAIWFAAIFNQDQLAKYDSVGVIKENNPEMLVAFEAVTPENLPAFIEKYQTAGLDMNAQLKAQQLQKDILYTYISGLKELTEETFPAYQSNFDNYAKGLFEKADQPQSYIDGFKKVKDFKGLDNYIAKLDLQYADIKQDFVLQKEYIKSYNSLLAQADVVQAVVSDTKKAVDLKLLQDEVKGYVSETKILSVTMILVYVLAMITIFLLILFAVIGLVTNIKTSYKSLLVVIGFVLLLLVGYFTASPELSASAIKEHLSVTNIKWIGAGMFTFYVVFFAAILSIIVTIILNAIKNRK